MAATSKSTNNSESIPSDLNPQQALGLVGLGMMQRISRDGATSRLRLVEDNEGKHDLNALRQRLELVALAIETGSPLSTSEVSYLLGARPGSATTKRGGLLAQKLSRNVWKISRAEEDRKSSYWRN